MASAMRAVAVATCSHRDVQGQGMAQTIRGSSTIVDSQTARLLPASCRKIGRAQKAGKCVLTVASSSKTNDPCRLGARLPVKSVSSEASWQSALAAAGLSHATPARSAQFSWYLKPHGAKATTLCAVARASKGLGEEYGAPGAVVQEIAQEILEEALLEEDKHAAESGAGRSDGGSKAESHADESTNGASADAAGVKTGFWEWRGHRIRFQAAGDQGPALLLIHGFGANCDHWRKNLPVLAAKHRVFAIDLLGYGFSDKPSPRDAAPNSIYNFENWGQQVNDFVSEVVKEPVFCICNSVGGIVGLQAHIDSPLQIRGLFLLNISLRMLHIKKQSPFSRPFVSALQYVLRNTNLGQAFFASVATPRAVKNILSQCYHDTSAVTDELVDKILKPGLQPGAVDVFLDFICYSGGPLPEELLAQAECPVVIGWGEEDPWEPIALGKNFGDIPNVNDFIILPGVGHCPQDEAPGVVNPLIEKFVEKYSFASS